jgi:maleate isomerase
LRLVLGQMGKDARRAAKALAMVRPKIIAFGCTSGSFYQGIEYDRELIRRIEAETGIPAITTSTAVVQALQELKLYKLCLISPYAEYVNKWAKDFLEANGFEVHISKGLGLSPVEGQNLAESVTAPEVAYELAKNTYDEGCDGVFASCTLFRTIEILERFEREVGKPMISSNQATTWLALKKVGVSQPIMGFGELLTHL